MSEQRSENKIAWLVPSHAIRREFNTNLAKTFVKYNEDVDLYFMWTKKEDNQIDFNSNIKHFYLEDYISERRIEQYIEIGSIINVKKILGLKLLKDGYKGIVCTDDEVEFVRQFKSQEISEHFSQYNEIPVHKTANPRLQGISKACAGLLPHEGYLIIEKESKNFQLYGWFADLPYYEAHEINEFLTRYEIFNETNLKRLSSQTFDYIMYQFYCILYGNRTYLVMKWHEPNSVQSWFEIFNCSRRGRAYAREYQAIHPPLWASSSELLSIFTSAFCVYHLDRKVIVENFLTSSQNHLRKKLRSLRTILRRFKS